MKPKACIIIEHIEGNIRECAFELASLARMDHLIDRYDWSAAIAGNDIENAAALFAEKTGIHVIALRNDSLERFSGEGYLRAYECAAREVVPEIVFASHTPLGCDIAPALAVKRGMSFVSSVQKIAFSNERIMATRERCNGKIREDIVLPVPTVCTIMPGALPACKHAETSGRVSVRNIDIGKLQSLPGTITHSLTSGAELTNAEVIVSAGRGVGTPQHMEHLRNLASLFPRSAIGGSRAACDMGLVDYGFQIGMTGRSVSPKLYFACGISGSAQHIAGMKNARAIVAINRDKNAPIFQIADVGVVDAIERFVPVFVDLVGDKKDL